MTKCLLPLVVLGALAACGGDDSRRERSADNRATVQAILASQAAVLRAAGPLYACLPGDNDCYREAGPAIVDAVERELPLVDAAIEQTDDECIAGAARAFRDELAAYSRLGRAATDGDTGTANEEDAETARLEGDFVKRIRRCEPAEGRPAQLARRFSAVGDDIAELGARMPACRDAACLRDLAEQMETSAVIGQSVLDAMVEGMADDAPDCAETAFSEYQTVLATLEGMAEKIQRGRFAAAERDAARVVELGPAAEGDLAACIGSVGS